MLRSPYRRDPAFPFAVTLRQSAASDTRIPHSRPLHVDARATEVALDQRPPLGLRTDARRVTRHLRLAQHHRSGAPLSRLAEERGWTSARARRHYSSEKRVESPARGLPTNGRRRGLALFEARAWGSREREFAEVLVLAAGRSTDVTRRAFEDE